MTDKQLPAFPRIVPGRGKYAGQAFVIHGCMSDGPYTYKQAEWARRELIRNPVNQATYDDFERRGLGGMATHFLTDDHSAIDPAKLAAAVA